MASKIGGLFGKYSGTYATSGRGGVGREVLDAKGQRKTSRYELRGFDDNVPRISKRGGNFLDRVVCWLEDRVFSLTRSGKSPSLRQKSSYQFAYDVGEALLEIDPNLGAEGGNVDTHELVRRIESVRVRDLSLRSGFVRDILQEVATLAREADHGDTLPELARNAFPVQNPVRDEDPEQPAADPEAGAPGNNHEDEEAFQQVLPPPDAPVGRENRQEGGEDVAPPDRPVELNQEVAPQLVARPAEALFNFTGLSEEELFDKLRDPVRSKMVKPLLDQRNFWKDGDYEEKNKAADAMVHLVSAKLVGGFGGCENVQKVMNNHLGTLRNFDIPEDQRTDGQLQTEALNITVQTFSENEDALESTYRIVVEGIGNYTGRKEGVFLGAENVEQQPIVHPEMGVPGNGRGDEELPHPVLPPPNVFAARGGYRQQEGGAYVAVQRDGPVAPHQEMQIQPAADPVEEKFSFTNLNDEQLFDKLNDPVKSKIVNPLLEDRDFWEGGYNEEKGKVVDEIVRSVSARLVAVLGNHEQVKLDANDKLEVLTFYDDKTDKLTDMQLQRGALGVVVQEHMEKDAEQTKRIVMAGINRYLGQGVPLGVENVEQPPFAGPVEAPFSFADLDDGQLFDKLRAPVMSKIVNPLLAEQGFLKGRYSDEEQKVVDRIVRLVSIRLVTSFGNYNEVRDAANKNLDTLREQDQVGQTDAQLQTWALELVAVEYDEEKAAGQAMQVVTQEISRHGAHGREKVDMHPGPKSTAPPEDVAQVQLAADSVRGVFSFMGLENEEFYSRLSEPVKSKIVAPELREQDFLQDGADEKTVDIVRWISRTVAGEIVATSGGIGEVKQAANEALELYRVAVDENNPLSDEQLQSRVLENVVEQYQGKGADVVGRLKETVATELVYHLNKAKKPSAPVEEQKEVAADRPAKPQYAMPGVQAEGVHAAQQRALDEQLPFQQMSSEGFLKRLSEQVEAEYVLPVLGAMERQDGPEKDKMKEIMTVNATVWFVASIKGGKTDIIKQGAQESYNVKATFYGPEVQGGEIQNEVLKNLCVDGLTGREKEKLYKIAGDNTLIQAGLGRDDDVYIGKVILDRIAGYLEVEARRLPAHGSAVEHQHGNNIIDPNKEAVAGSQSIVPEPDDFSQPVGPTRSGRS